MRKTLGIVILVSVLWIIVGHSYSDSDPASGSSIAKVGSEAPNFTLPSLDGKSYSFSEAKGKPIVLNFWNSWCGPCKKETPELVKLYNQHKGQFRMIGINITANSDTVGAVKLFVQDYNMTYPVLLDKKGKVSSRYRVHSIPTTYLIDENGVIVAKFVGYQGNGALTRKIEAFISK
ncbi:MAG TPA: TlpA disulfide reductase family protein [Bacillales bacterium]|nr:TlpA disulfide reductase family protein [Bacillales bacterium]